MFPPPSQNTVGARKQITFLNLYYISSWMDTFLKITDSPIQFPSIFYPSVSFMYLNFSFQIFFLSFCNVCQNHVLYCSDYLLSPYLLVARRQGWTVVIRTNTRRERKGIAGLRFVLFPYSDSWIGNPLSQNSLEFGLCSFYWCVVSTSFVFRLYSILLILLCIYDYY